MRTRSVLAIVLLLTTASLGTATAGAIAVPTDPGTAASGESLARSADEPCTFPLTVTDATGTEVRVDAEPERVVTLNPSAAQTMWEIGARAKVVGLTKYASYLEGSASRKNVSGPSSIVVVETVVDLSPDLVLAPNATPAATVEQLRAADLAVYRFPEAETLEDVYAKTRIIGRLVGDCDGAEETVAWMHDRIETARVASEGQKRPDVLYAFFGYTAGRGTFIDEVIEAAGGNNVAADYGLTGYRQLSPEVVVEADPDWIVRNANDPVLPEGEPFNSTTAAREGQLVVVPIEHLNQPAPRIVHGISVLAKHFHPDAYAAANATARGTETGVTEAQPTTSATRPNETGGSEPTRTPGQPGLGAFPALVAIAVALVAVRGRG